MDVPTGTYRPERTPAVVLTSLGRTHQAVVGIEEIALGVGIVEGEQTATVAGDALCSCRLAFLGILYGKLDVVHEVVGESLGRHGGVVVFVVSHAHLSVDEDQVFLPLL